MILLHQQLAEICSPISFFFPLLRVEKNKKKILRQDVDTWTQRGPFVIKMKTWLKVGVNHPLLTNYVLKPFLFSVSRGKRLPLERNVCVCLQSGSPGLSSVSSKIKATDGVI